MIICTFEKGNKADPGLRHVVIDTLVLNENKVLLVKRSLELSEGGKWGLIGGFMSINETIVQAVMREAFEETGYKIKNPTLLTVIDNPNRPNEDRQNISFVYFCYSGEKEGDSDWESTEQKWFDLDNLPPEQDLAFDHYEIIQMYKKYKKENTSLPIINY